MRGREELGGQQGGAAPRRPSQCLVLVGLGVGLPAGPLRMLQGSRHLTTTQCGCGRQGLAPGHRALGMVAAFPRGSWLTVGHTPRPSAGGGVPVDRLELGGLLPCHL